MKGYSHSLQLTIALTQPAIPTTITLLHHPRPAPRHPQRHNHQQLVRRPPTSDSHRRPPKRSPSLRASSSYWTSTAPSSSAPRALPSPPAANAINTPRPAASCPARISPSSARISSRRRRALGSTSWSGARRSLTASRIWCYMLLAAIEISSSPYGHETPSGSPRITTVRPSLCIIPSSPCYE